MEVAGQVDDSFNYATSNISVSPGVNTIMLSCTVCEAYLPFQDSLTKHQDSHSGIFRVASSSIYIPKIHFHYTHPSHDATAAPPVSPMTGQLTLPSTLSTRWFIKIPTDPMAVDVEISLPRTSAYLSITAMMRVDDWIRQLNGIRNRESCWICARGETCWKKRL